MPTPPARLALLLLAVAAGCGGNGPPLNPNAFVGSYAVTVTANGQTDMDLMDVVAGADETVLLTFTYGFHPDIRCLVSGSTGLTVPRQTLHVEHSTGELDGQATGMGTLMNGSFALTLELVTPGIAAPDGGANSTGPVTYQVAGKKQ